MLFRKYKYSMHSYIVDCFKHIMILQNKFKGGFLLIEEEMCCWCSKTDAWLKKTTCEHRQDTFNTLRPRQNGQRFAGTFKYNFWNENFPIPNKFHWNISLMVFWQWSIICSDNGLAPNRRQAIIWTSDGVVYCHAYASTVSMNSRQKWKIR